MDEFWKVLAGSGITGALLGYYLVRLEPRLKSLENTVARQGKIDLLKMAASPQVAPELKGVATTMIAEIDAELSEK